MLVLEYVRWWYGRGWAGATNRAKEQLAALADAFSISILLRTLLAPWKRIISYPGAGLDAHMRAFVDNLVSRFIGFFIRITVLIAAAVAFVLVFILGLVQLIVWPLLPLIGIALLVWGFL
jgi:hypothetical protein